jgi:hypothetical protein
LKKSNQKTFAPGGMGFGNSKARAGRLKGGRAKALPAAPGAKIFCGAFL